MGEIQKSKTKGFWKNRTSSLCSSLSSQDPEYRDCIETDVINMFKTFQALDKNGDGSVTKQELLAAMRDRPDIAEALGLTTQKDATSLLESADTDKNGEMDFQEFSRILSSGLLRNSLVDDSTAKRIFQKVDTNGDGSVDRSELKAAYAIMICMKGEKT